LPLSAAQQAQKAEALAQIDSVGEAFVALSEALRPLQSEQLDAVITECVNALANARNNVDAI
jgi:hypothetical protein